MKDLEPRDPLLEFIRVIKAILCACAMCVAAHAHNPYWLAVFSVWYMSWGV